MKRAFVLLSFVAAISSAARAQQTGRLQQVADLLEWAVAEMVSDGYTPADPPRMGRLAHGANTYIPIPLVADREYQIIGICDDACTDLDLQLFSPEHRLLDADHSADDLPVLFTAARASGTHFLRVWMNGCAAPSCGFGVAAFTRAD